MKTFRHGGKVGDCVYSLPTIRELGGGILYLPEKTGECDHLYSSLKDLLLLQPYIHEVREYPSGYAYMQQAPGIAIDYDLDLARLQPGKGVTHIVKRYLDAFKVNLPNWKDPWLVIDDKPSGLTGPYTVINYTGRHRYNAQTNTHSRVDWKKVVERIEGRKVFVGLPEEHQRFIEQFTFVDYFPTRNLLEVARVLRDCVALYSHQSSLLALAQSLSVDYYLDVKPGKLNCLTFSNREHILK